jgi:hypothetical protein
MCLHNALPGGERFAQIAKVKAKVSPAEDARISTSHQGDVKK